MVLVRRCLAWEPSTVPEFYDERTLGTMSGTFITRAETALTPRKSTKSTQKLPTAAINQARASTALSKRRTRRPIRDLTRFGADTPSWTIGGSRRQPKNPPDYPSPDQYNVPTDPFPARPGHVIQSRETPTSRTLTSDIPYIEHRRFPEFRKCTIGVLDGTSFVPKSETPGPSYFPDDYKPKHNYKQHVIELKRDGPKPDKIPSALEYNPKDPSRPSTPSYSLPKAPVKRFNDDIDDGTPGPGAYNVGPQIRRAPRWTERIRVLPSRYKYQRRPPREKPWEVNPA